MKAKSAGDAVGADGPRILTAMPVAAQGAEPPAGQDELLQFQLRQLIVGILAQQDLDPGTRLALLRHLAENPGHPGQALLAHLRELRDPEDLPPFKACRKPPLQSTASQQASPQA